MSKQSKYSQEFRDTAVQLAEAGGRPVAQVAKELGVDKHLLYGWIKAAQGKQKKSSRKSQPNPELSAEQQLKQLQRRNKELEMENEILKKAAA